MSKKEELKKLARKITDCTKCALKGSRENTVPDEGPVNAKIMIIGQAPGAKENETGRPFVGRAGQFLNYLLEIAEIERKRVFITSIIKCFPPKNRKPTKKEIEFCLPYLKDQIKIINPQNIILLGEVAFSAFFPNEKIKDSRGKWIKKYGKQFFVTYHPAAGLRFPKIKKLLEKDFQKLKIKK